MTPSKDWLPRRMLRRVRGRRQASSLETFLDREVAQGLDYSTAGRDSRLSRLRGSRRGFGTRPRVLAFGTEEWEQHGLWPAFGEVADFSLWRYREPFTRPASRGSAYRRSLADAFLAHVVKSNREHPIDIAFFYASAEHIDTSLLDRLHDLGIWSWIMGLDDRHQFYELDEPGGSQLGLARACDLYMTTWPLGAGIVNGRGGRAWYTGTGAHADFHRPVPVERDLDVVFVGQAYGERTALVRYLRRHGISVAAYGAGWPGGHVGFDEQITLFSRARVVLGVGGVRQMPGVTTVKGRDFEVPMCGAVYLTSYCPDLADFFQIGQEILCYSSFHDCREQVERALGDEQGADRTRNAARERSLRDHTWQKRLREGIDMLRHGELVA